MNGGLILDNVRSALPGAPVVGPLSLEVAAGDVLAILGPSGAGKTTLLRAIAGLIPGTGRVLVGGTNHGTAPPEARRIVYLHQTPRLFPHLDVAGNIAFPVRLRGTSESAVRARTTALLDLVQLGPLAARRISGLSGGERQRVALARALAADPDVLLLDEPFAALDPGLRAEVRSALEAVLASSRLATILVTHDLEEAGWLAGRAGVLLGGTLVQLDAPARLFESPRSLAVAAFLEIPNRWTREEASPWLPNLPPEATHVVLPATAVQATANPAGHAIVERLLPTRDRLRLLVRAGKLGVVAEAIGASPVPGNRVSLTVHGDRANYYDRAGERIPGE